MRTSAHPPIRVAPEVYGQTPPHPERGHLEAYREARPAVHDRYDGQTGGNDGVPPRPPTPIEETLGRLERAYYDIQDGDSPVARILGRALEAARRTVAPSVVELRVGKNRAWFRKGEAEPRPVAGSIQRVRRDDGSIAVEFRPFWRRQASVSLPPHLFDGVANGAKVVLSKSSAKEVSFEPAKVSVARNMVGQVRVDPESGEVYAQAIRPTQVRQTEHGMVAADNPFSPVQRVPLPGVSAEQRGQLVLVDIHDPIEPETRFGVVREILDAGDAWRNFFLQLAVDHGRPATLPEGIHRELDAHFERIEALEAGDASHFEALGYEDRRAAFPFAFSPDNPYSTDIDQVILDVQPRPGGGYRLTYGFADVDLFSKEGTEVHRHLEEFGASTYGPSIHLGMLPPEGSEDKVSLDQDKPRPAFVVEFSVGADGRLLPEETEVHDWIIQNHLQTSYHAVQDYLEGRGGLDRGTAALVDRFREATDVMRAAAKEDGMMDLSLPKLNAFVHQDGGLQVALETGLPIEKNNAILSITANHAAGLYAARRAQENARGIEGSLKMPWRSMPQPDGFKERLFGHIVRDMGHPMRGDEGRNAYLERKQEELEATDPVLRAIQLAFLTTTSRASISLEPGHFGVAKDHYAWVTAAMRRAPDHVVQGIVRALRDGKPVPYQEPGVMESFIDSVNDAASEVKAYERAVREVLTAAALEPMTGQVVSGVVGRVGPRGFNVMLEAPAVSLFVSLHDLNEQLGTTLRLKRGALVDGEGRYQIRAGARVPLHIDEVAVEEGRIELHVGDLGHGR